MAAAEALRRAGPRLLRMRWLPASSRALLPGGVRYPLEIDAVAVEPRCGQRAPRFLAWGSGCRAAHLQAVVRIGAGSEPRTRSSAPASQEMLCIWRSAFLFPSLCPILVGDTGSRVVTALGVGFSECRRRGASMDQKTRILHVFLGTPCEAIDFWKHLKQSPLCHELLHAACFTQIPMQVS